MGLDDGEVGPLREFGATAICQLVWKYHSILTTYSHTNICTWYVMRLTPDIVKQFEGSRSWVRAGSPGISVEVPRVNRPRVSPVDGRAFRGPDLMQAGIEVQQGSRYLSGALIHNLGSFGNLLKISVPRCQLRPVKSVYLWVGFPLLLWVRLYPVLKEINKWRYYVNFCKHAFLWFLRECGEEQQYQLPFLSTL